MKEMNYVEFYARSFGLKHFLGFDIWRQCSEGYLQVTIMIRINFALAGVHLYSLK